LKEIFIDKLALKDVYRIYLFIYIFIIIFKIYKRIGLIEKLNFNLFNFIIISFFVFYLKIISIIFYYNMGFGVGGLGIGDWGLGPIPNPQSPIPNPQSPYLSCI